MDNGLFKSLFTVGVAIMASKNARLTGKDPAVESLKWGGLAYIGLDLLLTEEKNTLNYALKKKDKLVYHGITDKERKAKRILEHKYDGKVFDCAVFGPPKTREDAARIEKKRIQRDKPKYNKHHK